MIPTSYEQWRECIEVHCETPLTPAFIEERLKELENANDSKTKTFAKLYGADHLQRTIGWFQRAKDDAANG
ncbi:MAG: hypothetical protein AAF726_24395 [Planctomycetota bacterium]